MGSNAAATCFSRWVSTPPVIGRAASTMVDAIPSFLHLVRGGTAVPGRSEEVPQVSATSETITPHFGTGRARLYHQTTLRTNDDVRVDPSAIVTELGRPFATSPVCCCDYPVR